MSDRATQIDAFLHAAGWQTALRTPLAGDLSSRHYTRLGMGEKTAILMDADTTMAPFLTMTHWLADHGFSVPNIIAEDAKNGLLLLKDLGDLSVTQHLTQTGDTDQIDTLIIDLLLALRKTPAPDLPTPDANTLVDWTKLADQHYPGINPKALTPFRKVLHSALSIALQTPPTLSLRDFHADNLMWLPNGERIARLGLLDYQDAFLTHPCYDLVSYLTDARTQITPARREAVLAQYLTRSGDNPTTFRAAFAAVSAQRNLRILGIFTKSAAAGKAHHLPKLPRVHAYFAEALQHDMFHDVRAETLAALPNPATVQKALA